MIDTQALRKKVLDAAIRGKLTMQLPEDGNADELYKEIQKEKQRLIEEGMIKKEKPFPDITDNDIPFDIPETWKWVRLNAVGLDFADGPFGSNLKKEHYTDNPEVRIIQLSNIGEYGWRDENVKFTTYKHCDSIIRSKVDPGDIVIAKMMPAGRAIIVPELGTGFVLSSDAIKVVPSPYIDVRFLLYAINSNVFRDQIYSEVQGTTRVRTSLAKVRGYLIPLPPLAEQKRIVSMIETIFAQLDLIDEEQKKLTDNSFSLRNKLIELGIKGELTEQLAEDGNAEYLYDEIQKEKQRLIKEGKIKKDKNESYIFRRDNSHYEKRGNNERCIDNEIPFDIPDNWMWVRLQSVCRKIVDGDHNPPKGEIKQTDYLLLSSLNINNDRLVSLNNCRYLSKEAFEIENQRTAIEVGDIFLTTVATLGRSCIYEGGLNISFQRSVSIISSLINNRYLKAVFDSPFFQNLMVSEASGTAQKGFYLNQLASTIIPLPPLVEQLRIVSRLNQLLPLCDYLSGINK